MHLPAALCSLCLTLSSDARKGGHRDLPFPVPRQQEHFGASSDTMPSDIEVVIPGMSDHLSLHRSILRARSSTLNEILGRKNAREVRCCGWPRRAVGTLAVADSQDGLMLIMVLRYCYGVDLRLTPEEILVMFRCPDSDSEDSNWEALAGWTKKVLIRGNIQRNRAEVLEKLAFAVSECLEAIDEQELEEDEERRRALTGEKRKKERNGPIKPNPKDPRALHKYQDCW